MVGHPTAERAGPRSQLPRDRQPRRFRLPANRGVAIVDEDDAAELGGGRRPAEEEALHLVAVDHVDETDLARVLHALDGDAHAQRPAERDDGADDLLGIGIVGIEGVHEGAVDLDLVEGESPEIAEARIAGAEVVHDDGNAEGLQGRQLGEKGLGVVEEQALGDLKLEAMRGEAGLLEHPGDGGGDVAGGELRRREVDRDHQVLRPGERGGTGLFQDPCADPIDEAHGLGDRDERRRRNEAAVPGRQPEQGLEADQLAAGVLELRLIVEKEAVALDRRLDRALVSEAGIEGGVELGREQPHLLRSLALGLVEGEIGALEQPSGIAAVVGGDRHADAAGDAHLLALHAEGRGQLRRRSARPWR